MTLAEFAEDLEDVLRSLCERPGRWILIAEDVAHHHHFWQALCFEDRRSTSRPCRTTTWRRMTGSPPRMRVCCESVDGRAPIFPGPRNWSRTEFTTPPDIGGVAQQTVRAVREGFGLGDGDKVFVKMFSSPLRGHTPASPTFEEVGEPDDVASGSWHDYRVKGASVERASERPTASIADVQAAVAVVPPKYRVAILLAAWCQLRRSEVLGLQRRDIDLPGGFLSVERTWDQMEGGRTTSDRRRRRLGGAR